MIGMIEAKVTFNLKNMDEIDISQKIADFKQVFKNESRMILSAKFGDGKSYFLNKFINSFDPKNNDYYFITLHPVNYVVEDNKDIIEYIKRDILFQLIKDDRIFDYKEEGDKIFDSVCNKESLSKLAGFMSSIIPLPVLGDVVGKIEALVDTTKTIVDKYQEQDVAGNAEDYLNGFYGKEGHISECDAFAMLIQKTLEHAIAKSVLIIEDLDRIDPAHLFRIMNVLSSQVDNPYYSDCHNSNKFGFDNIILVMDYDMTGHLFHHFYGQQANYEGYMNKFMSSIPFQFSITQEAQKQVREKIKGMLGLSDLSKINDDLTPNTYDKHPISLDMCIDRLSVLQCKEFLDVNVAMRIKTNWRNRGRIIPTSIPFVKLLVTFKLVSSYSLPMIFYALVSGMSGETLLYFLLPLFCECTRHAYYFIKDGSNRYECSYDVDTHRVDIVPSRVVDDTNPEVDIFRVRDRVNSMKDEILDLIIG